MCGEFVQFAELPQQNRGPGARQAGDEYRPIDRGVGQPICQQPGFPVAESAPCRLMMQNEGSKHGLPLALRMLLSAIVFIRLSLIAAAPAPSPHGAHRPPQQNNHRYREDAQHGERRRQEGQPSARPQIGPAVLGVSASERRRQMTAKAVQCFASWLFSMSRNRY